jgi:hypothetical protein
MMGHGMAFNQYAEQRLTQPFTPPFDSDGLEFHSADLKNKTILVYHPVDTLLPVDPILNFFYSKKNAPIAFDPDGASDLHDRKPFSLHPL